jgi:hypothetical protein
MVRCARRPKKEDAEEAARKLNGSRRGTSLNGGKAGVDADESMTTDEQQGGSQQSTGDGDKDGDEQDARCWCGGV